MRQKWCCINLMRYGIAKLRHRIAKTVKSTELCKIQCLKCVGFNKFNFPSLCCFPHTAPPSTPFPIIEECEDFHNTEEPEEDEQNCSLIGLSVNITCSAFGFFPNISLSFRHNSSNIVTFRLMESNNTDGTRNKSVMIQAFASDEPYVCVAADIPGSLDHIQTSSITISAPPTESTTRQNVLTTATDQVITRHSHTREYT